MCIVPLVDCKNGGPHPGNFTLNGHSYSEVCAVPCDHEVRCRREGRRIVPVVCKGIEAVCTQCVANGKGEGPTQLQRTARKLNTTLAEYPHWTHAGDLLRRIVLKDSIWLTAPTPEVLPAIEDQIKKEYLWWPATAQTPLPNWFHSGGVRSGGWQTRYQAVLEENYSLLAPITYETLDQYLARRSGKGIDRLYLEGEYWAWCFDHRNWNWLPRDEAVNRFKRWVYDGNRANNEDRLLPTGHSWFIDGRFHMPANWEAKLATPTQAIRRMRYLIAYNKAYWSVYR